MRKLGIYIHIPFCQRKCAYCDFYSLNCGSKNSLKEYTDALCRHIRSESHLYKDCTVDSVFLGGGTPSLLDCEDIEKIVSTLKTKFTFSTGTEFTIEANPGTLTEEKLKCYLKNGINRLSIGLQSASDNELSILGRIHTVKEFEKGYTLARECGFKNISIDVMYGLPDQTVQDFQKTLDYVCKIAPEHISSYCLKIEDNTPFGRIRSSLNLPNDDIEYQMYIQMCESLNKSGWKQYEISNFAREGYRSRHNLKYWLSEEYVGFGPGAHSFFDGVRYYFEPSLEKYLLAPVKIYEEITEKRDSVYIIDKMDEYVMLKLRLYDGISDSELFERFGVDFISSYPEAQKFIKSGHIQKENDTYRFTPEGFFVSNYIFTEILHF